MAKDGANALLLTKLDDLMWLFNIRGCDVECNPVAMSYAYITEESATLFIQRKALDAQVTEYLAAHRIEGIRHRRRFPEGTPCGQCDPRGQQILQLYFIQDIAEESEVSRGQEPHRTVKGH